MHIKPDFPINKKLLENCNVDVMLQIEKCSLISDYQFIMLQNSGVSKQQ